MTYGGGIFRSFVVVEVVSASVAASPDKHYYRILVQAIEEAHSEGPTSDAKVLGIWRTEMTKLGDGACKCAQLTGLVEVAGRYIEKRALCNQALVEDLGVALMPELLRLPGNYERWKDALNKTEAEAAAVGEDLATKFVSTNVTAKEQAGIRRRAGRCITGGEDH
jgi:hypothetical protein